MSLVSTVSAPHACVSSYDDALARIRQRFARLSVDVPLFVTDAADLWDVFLRSIDPEHRQHYTCHACRHFIHRYGNLAWIDPTNHRLYSPLWSISGVYPHGLSRAFAAMAKAVKRARIVTVFKSSSRELGTENTGGWSHFSATVGARHLHKSPLMTAAQAMAEKREEHAMLSRSFGDFPHNLVRSVAELLKSGQLYRSEKCEGVADWLLALYDQRAELPSSLRDNATWLAVASAPVGYCHVRSGMIGTLLEDVQAGLPFGEIKRRFDEKMHPLQYLRPQVAPSAGNIAQAERVVAQLRTAGALERRFARLEEVEAFWRPTTEDKPREGDGVFGHLRAASARKTASVLPQQTMTWVKFRDTVLPTAQSVAFNTGTVQPFVALVTAVNPDAPPILQWDREDRRNPTSWYLYNGGSTPPSWALPANTWVKVDAFTLRPCHWHGHVSAKEGEGVIAILHGARDVRHTNGGGFFPESLRSEYHAVRRTLEAYAKSARIQGRDEATACGVMLTNSHGYSDIRFRVTTKIGSVSTYKIDRWD